MEVEKEKKHKNIKEKIEVMLVMHELMNFKCKIRLKKLIKLI
jgi:hypothetical protein